MRRLTLLGSTGSIGRQALAVVRAHPDRFDVVALLAGANAALLAEQAAEFEPEYVALESGDASLLDGLDAEVLTGPGSARTLSEFPADVVLNGIVGFAGLSATVGALQAGNRVALANKESLVAGGEWIMDLAKDNRIIPVDSEHSAIFQCLEERNVAEVGEILLTASGGPFFGFGKGRLAEVVYQKEGFDQGADFQYGGPNVAVEPIILAGKCTMGLCNSETMAAAVQQGAKLKVVGAFMQTNPFCIVSLPDNPIKTAQDMIGKKIAVQALNDTLWSALLKINNIDESQVTKVVAQFDPAPLINKEVDGFLSFVTNQNITVELQTGITPTIMMLSDYGFTLYQQLYTVSEDTLSKHRDAVIAGLKAEIIGRQMCAADQAAGVALSLDKYSVDLKQDPKYAARALAETVKLGDTPTTKAKGLLYMSADDITKNVATLKLLGLEVPASTYTTELLDEIFADGPTLTA